MPGRLQRIGRGRLAAIAVGLLGVLVATAALARPWSAGPARQNTRTFSFPADADAYVSGQQPSATFGHTTMLRVGSATRKLRSYLTFDVGGLQGRISRATLRVYALSDSQTGVFVAPARRDVVDEDTLTAGNAPQAGAVLDGSGPVTANTWASVDVTPAVTGPGPVTFVLLGSDERTIRLASRTSGSTAPRLVVETELGRSARAVAPEAGLPRAGGGDPVIGAAGDIACGPASEAGTDDLLPAPPERCRQQATSDILLHDQVTAVLPLGDDQYENGTLARFEASYGPSWGRLNDRTHPTAGNHEYIASRQSKDGDGYFGYFGAAAGEAGKGWYSYDIGTWHLISLNAQCAFIGGCGAGSPEERWLKADLAAHPAACTLAYWHQPRFSSGQHGDDAAYDAFWRDLYAAGADVVLNGHDHDYERFAPQAPAGRPDPARGIREFVVGTGGRSHYQFKTVRPNSQVRNATTFGVLELTLHNGGYDFRFVPEPGGSFTDSGSGRCH